LLENDRVVSVQIYIQAFNEYSAFRGALPFDIDREMNADDLERLLGSPSLRDKYGSAFMRQDLKLSVDFDRNSRITMLCIDAHDT
jgi:hypothetical protein